MVIAFANNQTMTAIDGEPSVITTDPVPMRRNDRATANLNVHYIFAQPSATPDIAYQAQVSNDGVHWVDVTGLSDNTGSTTSVPRQVVQEAHGAFIRFKFTLTVSGGSGSEVGGCGFDLHVKLDHE